MTLLIHNLVYSFPFASKTARAQYMQAQDFLRHEMGLKYSERHRGRLIEEMVWGVPSFSNHLKLEVDHDDI